jgi:DNA-binding TFAR19-related protein (PDSD5 family)
MKTCFRCNKEYPITSFSLNKTHKDGHGSYCKECLKEKNREYRIKNPEKIKNNAKLWAEKNKDYVREKQKQYQREHKEQFSGYQKKHYNKNKQKINQKNKVYADAHKEETRERGHRWRINNPEKAREVQRRHGQKVRSTAMGRISENISSEISRSMKRGPKGRGHWEELVGYTKAQLKRHLESLFTPEMSWENYGSYWHIDHIIPISVFNFSTPEDIDFKKAWSLSNLQPLNAIDNMKKHAKLNKPFQPALAIAI